MSTPAPPPAPQQPPNPSKRNALPLVVGSGIVVVIGLVVVLVLVLGGGKNAADARSVQDVADLAVDAAEDLDVTKGIDLLCDPPPEQERAALDQLIADGRDEAGTDDPDVDYTISDVEGDAEGSFTVTVSSDDPGLAGHEFTMTVSVETRGDRSCIARLLSRDMDPESSE